MFNKYSLNKTMPLLVCIAILFTFLLVSCDKAQVQIEQNIANAKRIFDEGYNNKNVNVIDDLVAENYVHHWNTKETPQKGPEVIKEDIEGQWQYASDFKFIIKDIFAHKSNVTIRFVYEGTFENLGKKASSPGITIARFENGKLVESWTVFDRESLIKELGYSIMPPSAPEN